MEVAHNDLVLAVVLFWISVGLIVYTHLGYPLVLGVLARRRRATMPKLDAGLPRVSLIIAAHNEEPIIAERVQNALALDYPRELLEVIVASDGSSDRTVEQARRAGARVLQLERCGKIRAQDAAVEQSGGEIVAFSDANSFWASDALRELVRAFEDPAVGYACGQVRFVGDGGANREGIYWRYEMMVRSFESRLEGVTAGNGAIYATRRRSYLVVDSRMGHDLSFPFNMVKRGWRAVYVPSAQAQEKMVPSIEGEFSRKRRMMSHTWPIVLTGGMLSPRGYTWLYAFEILSHRLLRYLTPFLHLTAFVCNLFLLGDGLVYTLAFALQLALFGCAALAALFSLAPFRLAYYYVVVTASPALGLWDWLRFGTEAGWDKAEGTR